MFLDPFQKDGRGLIAGVLGYQPPSHRLLQDRCAHPPEVTVSALECLGARVDTGELLLDGGGDAYLFKGGGKRNVPFPQK